LFQAFHLDNLIHIIIQLHHLFKVLITLLESVGDVGSGNDQRDAGQSPFPYFEQLIGPRVVLGVLPVYPCKKTKPKIARPMMVIPSVRERVER